MAEKLNRLIALMMATACLSRYEAIYCIRDYRAGLMFSGEAVNHFGGTKEVLQRSIAMRTRLHEWRIARYNDAP